MASATGESFSASGFNRHAARTSTAHAIKVKAPANPSVSAPAGSARFAVRGLRRSNSRSAMRFMVIAAERAPTMAITIQRICRNDGRLPPARAASRAPTSANGSANTECSNLIISSTMRIRDLLIFGSTLETKKEYSSPRRREKRRNQFYRLRASRLPKISFLPRASIAKALRLAALPAILLFLREANLREDSVGELLDHVFYGLRAVVERWHRGHHDCACVVHAQHVFQVNPVERCLSQAEDQRAALLEANICGPRQQIAGSPRGDGAKRTGGARDYAHAIDKRTAGSDAGANVLVR